jgi:DNA-binding NtrC family response regulator
MPGKVLVVEDDRSMCEAVESVLVPRGYAVSWTTVPAQALSRIAEEDFEVVLTDVRMPGVDGLELCTRIVANRPELPVVVLTAFGTLETAVGAIRAGAYDFVTKPIEADALVIVLERALERRRLSDEVKRLRAAAMSVQGSDHLLGESPSIEELRQLVARVADSEASVLVTGESGTGKERVAQAIHALSRRREGPFLAINCAALPETLLEAELFGHAKGAFTDAKAGRVGLFLQAKGGTLFLDELGDLPLALQPKLLRALQERTVRPVGGSGEVPFDARIIAATNQDLESAVVEHRFREDLYYRVNVVHVEVPPLRARGGDVLLLAQRFIEGFAVREKKNVRGLSIPVGERLLAYGWPGNVRELQNAMERAVALTRFDEITVEDLPARIRRYEASDVVVAAHDPSELVTLEEVERRYIHHVLEAVGGNKTLAARTLGLDRSTLYRKLQEMKVDPGERVP